MRALLDTNTFLWAAADHPRLSRTAKTIILETQNEVFFSPVIAWEIAIKWARRKLDLAEPVATYVPTRVQAFGYSVLPIEVNHALGVAALPTHHNDPFDRLLIAQALVERLPVLTSNPHFARYGVEVIW